MSKKNSKKHDYKNKVVLSKFVHDVDWYVNEIEALHDCMDDFARCTGYVMQESGVINACEIRWYTKRGECVRFFADFKGRTH